MEVTIRRQSSRSLAFVAGLAALAMLATTGAAVAAPKTKLVNQKNGTQTSEAANTGDINKDGRFVVFQTTDDDLSAKDNNGESDIYLRNLAKGRTSIMSITSKGANGSNDSWDPVISANGRIVAWDSEAPGLLDGKAMTEWLVYYRDRKSGKTRLASVNSAGQPANDKAEDAHVSATGRFIVFDSAATNLTKKNTGGHRQVYLHDRVNRKTYLISKTTGGKPGTDDSYDAAVSAGGRYVTFVSTANNLSKKNDKGFEQIYRHDRKTGRTILISRKGKAGNGDSDDPEIAANGTVVFESEASNLGFDTNGEDDIYMWKGGFVKRISKSWNGKQLTGGSGGSEKPDITADGRYVTYSSDMTNVTKQGTSGTEHVYRLKLSTGRTKLVSRRGAQVGDDRSQNAHISDNGMFVIFDTDSTNLVPGGDSNGDTTTVLRRGPY